MNFSNLLAQSEWDGLQAAFDFGEAVGSVQTLLYAAIPLIAVLVVGIAISFMFVRWAVPK